MSENTVAISKCLSYESGLSEALARLLTDLGGMSKYVRSGQSVLIKPNMLTDRVPTEAVTTHPELIRCIIQEVRNAGGEPFVADSPNNSVKLDQVWNKTGIKNVCDEEDCPLLNLELAGSVTFTEDGCTFSISKPVLDADVIINVPKVKTHVLTILTASIKNMYGVVPGFQKTTLHKHYPKAPEFGKLMLEIYKKVKPTLNIADGILGMEGNGPASGNPRKLGFLAGSNDAFLLDMTICRILNIPYKAVPYLKIMNKEYSGLLDNIFIKGSNLEDVSPVDFAVPGTMRTKLIPGLLVKMLDPYLWIRPDIGDECVACGRCVTACPVDALTIGDIKKAVLEPKRCIGCCCCHEVCPENCIDMAQSPLLNFIRRGKM